MTGSSESWDEPWSFLLRIPSDSTAFSTAFPFPRCAYQRFRLYPASQWIPTYESPTRDCVWARFFGRRVGGLSGTGAVPFIDRIVDSTIDPSFLDQCCHWVRSGANARASVQH